MIHDTWATTTILRQSWNDTPGYLSNWGMQNTCEKVEVQNFTLFIVIPSVSHSLMHTEMKHWASRAQI